MRKTIIGVLVIILGIILISIAVTSSHSIKYENTIILPSNETSVIPYNGSSEIIFSYNFSEPVTVSGYPSSATTTNDSKIYVICFFSTDPGKIEVFNPNNVTSILYYSLYESSGLGLYSEYLFVIGPASIIAGIVLVIYDKVAKTNIKTNNKKK
ncbi:hypothetical protein [Acidianus manzaensis]|uniref:Uncharacterized protein n=1 Tax=Acidianus manzaensis TaxID=282676 RepID=A0A1W6K2H2_9CREN|nr:hypothetical protein [Acidianus manzaensis]ARM76728.1 hypothetical protein B6F84_12370 [Acidianus manzaensis]